MLAQTLSVRKGTHQLTAEALLHSPRFFANVEIGIYLCISMLCIVIKEIKIHAFRDISKTAKIFFTPVLIDALSNMYLNTY